MTYQWFKKIYQGNTATNWEAINGATDATLSASLMSEDAGQRTEYYCLVTNSLDNKADSVSSDIVSIAIEETDQRHNTLNIALNLGTIDTVLGDAKAPYYGISVVENGMADDFYSFTFDRSGDDTSYIKIEFDNSISNLDLYLYDSVGANVATALSQSSGVEIISFDGLPAGTYKIHIENYGGKTNTYQLTIAPSGSPTQPVVTRQPESATYEQEETAKPLSITATNSENLGTLSYQWQVSTDNLTWSNIADEVSEEYMPPTDAVGMMYYRCVVTNTLNSAALEAHTDSAIVRVIGKPVITMQPASATYLQGETAMTLSVAATSPVGLGTLSYQWYKNGTAIPDATSATLAATYISTSAAGLSQYHCVVTNSLDGKTSSIGTDLVTISVIAAPIIDTQPVSATYKQDDTATELSVMATVPASLGTLSYQWFEVGNSQVLSTDKEYFLEPKASVEKQYYCRVINTLDGRSISTDSTPATISVIDTPEIDENPESATYVSGATAAPLFLKAIKSNNNDPGTFSYQWQSSTDGNTWNDITGQTDTTYQHATSSAGAFYYRCIVTNSLNGLSLAETSSSAKISVIDRPSISQQPQSAVYWENDTIAALSVTASAPASLGEISYQWYKNGTAILGATLATLGDSYLSTSAAGESQYFCRITNTLDGKKMQVDSNSATIAVIGITEQPKSGVYAHGEKVMIAVTVAGIAQDGVMVEYLWQKSYGDGYWGPLTKGSSRTYSLPTDSVGVEQYRCLITVTMNGGTKEFISDTATMEIKSEKLIFDEVAKIYIYYTGHLEDDPNTPENEGATQYAGWTVDTIFGDDENYLGLYAEGLKNTNGDSLLVFRGTEMNSLSDIFADLDGKGIGYSQYIAAQKALINWAFDAGSSLYVIGHSLGGALAQWFASDFTSQGGTLAGVETFNSPGIAKNTTSSVKVATSLFVSANCGYVMHHIVNGDIVSMFGDEYIDGTVNLYTAAEADLLEKHTVVLADASFQKTMTASALSSGFFHYDGEFLNTIASLSSINSQLAVTAPLLFFRCTAEGARSIIGKYVVDKIPSISSNSISVPKVRLGPGWELKDVLITWSDGSYSVSAGLQPGQGAPTFGVTLGFVDYAPYINDVTAYMDAGGGLAKGIQLGVSPLYLQHIDATVGNIANPDNLTFSGNAGFTIGPKVLGQSLVTINGGIGVDKDSLAINASIVAINNWFFKATGSLEYNWSQDYFKGEVNAQLLGGLATFDAVMKVWNYKDAPTIVLAGEARVQIPKNVWLIGGWGVSAGVGVYITANGNNHDDYILVATSFDFFTNDGKWWKWSWKNDIGVKFYFDGKWDVIGASLKNLQELKNLAKSSRLATSAVPIDGLENPNLLVLDWGYTNENPLITFKLSDGRILTEAEMIENEYLMFVEELSSDTRRVYGVLEFSDPEIAQWEYTLDGDAAAITPELWGQEDNLDVHANSITGGGGQPYQFDVSVFSGESDASPDTVLTFYLSDGEERDFNGLPIWTTTLGELQNGGWLPPEDLAPGTYSLYVVAEYGNLVPAKAYFEEMIIIEASLVPISGVITTTAQGLAVSAIHEWQQFSCELWLSEAPAGQSQIVLAYDANLFMPVVADGVVQHQVADGVVLTFGDAIWNPEIGLTEWVVTVEIGGEFQWPGDSLLLAVIDFTPAQATDSGDIAGVPMEDVYRSGEETPWLVVNGESVLTNVWAVPYDLTDDGVVNIYDLIAFAKTYGSEKSEDIASDFTGDGDINIYDLIQFAKHYGVSLKDGNASIVIPRMNVAIQSAMATLSDALSPEVAVMFDIEVATETAAGDVPTKLFDDEYLPAVTVAMESFMQEQTAQMSTDTISTISPEGDAASENVTVGSVISADSVSENNSIVPQGSLSYAVTVLDEEAVGFSQFTDITPSMPAMLPLRCEAAYAIHQPHTRQLPTVPVADTMRHFVWADYDSIDQPEVGGDFLALQEHTSVRRQEISDFLFAEDADCEELVEMEPVFCQTAQQRLQRRWNG